MRASASRSAGAAPGWSRLHEPGAITLVVLALAVDAFVSKRIPLGTVTIAVSVSLWLSGILDLGQAMAGFGDPTVLYIATLLTVGEALDSTGSRR